MPVTFYHSESFGVSDYEATKADVTITLSFEQFAMNFELRSMLNLWACIHGSKDPQKEINAFAHYLTACQYGYNAQRDAMNERLLNCEKLYIQIRDNEIIKKIIEYDIRQKLTAK
jgi:hypothetical protein